ncbi:site-2 protease family protein [Nocardia huaxiensis]|uniref:Site-2 protease family protein n=1 Tax=Nocardia huaxiensis TaxID=2755382 RepID=A0A7D6VAH0_9NOCA|nr:site-2 protease family protein [Nocardia huaxiensis]QLY30774.1 site-2 protease family protein [Nocardia huaxiensis]
MTFPQVGRAHGAVRPSPVFLLVVLIAVAGGALAWDSAEWESWQAKLGVFIMVVAGWIVSVCLHEFAHAYVAWRAGDRDVEVRGYLTLNPLKYSHPLLSIGLPVVFIALGGFALPGGAVYVHSHNFSPRTQRILSGAGPAVNAVLAILLLVLIRVFGESAEYSNMPFWFGLSFLAFLQITATVLNLIPVPGTDGYGILEPSLSYQTRRSMDQIKPYGVLLLVAVLFFVPQVNQAFFNGIYALFTLSGVPEWWSVNGSILTRFWS